MSNSLQLRDGPLVRESAVLLALSLESRGHALQSKDEKLTVTEASKLTATDRAAIKENRLHLLALVAYCQEGHEPR